MRKIKRYIVKIKKKLCKMFRKKITIKKMFDIINLKLPKELYKIKDNYVPYVTMDLTRKKYPYGTVYFQDVYYQENAQKAYDKAKSLGAALCILTDKIVDESKDKIPYIVVKEPSIYFVRICKYINKSNKAITIAVTGSIGKTSAKQFIYEVISSKYKTKQNTGNDNLRLHIGANVQTLRKKDKFYVQEVGGCIPNMVYDSANILMPDCFVVTNIGDSHIESYGSKEEIAKDKLSLDKFLKPNGIAILNYDDKILSNAKLDHKIISYALDNKKADYYAKKITQKYDILEVIAKTPKGETTVKVNCIGKHNAYNVLIGLAIGHLYNLTNEEIKKSLENYHPSGVRQNLRRISGKLVYLDCFNSSYSSVKYALDAVKEIKLKKGKKIIVLGDVLEMGEKSKETHEKIGKLVNSYNYDLIITIGKDSKYIYDNIKNPQTEKFHAKNKNELIDFILKNLKRDDLIVFKASHGVYLNYVVDKIFGTRYYFGEKYKFRQQITDGEIDYTKIGNEIEIIKIRNKEKEITLKDEFENCKVVGLRANSFENIIAKKITLNNSLRHIEKKAFNNCKNLEEIDLKNVKYIYEDAFVNCEKLKKVYLSNINCHIENNAFVNCKNLELVLPKKSFVIEYAKENNIKYKIID